MNKIYPSDPMLTIASIRQFGLAADGSYLRDLEASIERQRSELEKAKALLKPFADCVFNDNGDVTITTSNLRPFDYFAAYTFIRDQRS